MKKRKKTRKALKITLLVLATLIALCIACVWLVADIGPNELRSLATITKVDDYPLYVMRFHGDYGFKDLQTGRGLKGLWKWTYEQLKPQDKGAMCTCFSTTNERQERFFGRNYDWSKTDAALLLFTDPPGKYASVSMVDITYFTFNTVDTCLLDYVVLIGAPYLPTDGMNECGVAVAAMQVPDASGISDPNKETLGISCLMRQILDNTATLDEAIALIRQYNVVFTYAPPIHLLISDASGNSAIVEFLNGSPEVIRSSEPFQPCTNFILSGKNVEQALDSCWRYSRAYKSLQESNGNVTSEQAMEILEGSSVDKTVWSTVFGQSTGKIQLAMDNDYGRIYEFSLEMKGKGETRTVTTPIRPAKASWPNPSDGTIISPYEELGLTWRTGTEAKSHRVYLGTDEDDLSLLAEVKAPEQLELPALTQGQTYYWRVDETGADGTVATGDTWQFTLGQLLGWWKLDGDANDSSGNGHDGTIKGDPNWVTGRIGGALEVDGVDDFLDTGSRIAPSSFTVVLWVSSPAAPSTESNSEVISCEPIHINWNQPGRFFRGAASLGVGERWHAAGFGELKANTWHHLCATYDGDTLMAYKNGVLTMTNNMPSGPPMAGKGTLKFGRHSLEFVEEYFRGTIDDVRIYDYALSPGEIRKLFEEAGSK